MVSGLRSVGDEFDPELVPMYPLLRAELRTLDEGGYAGLVNDQVVATDHELEPVRAAVIADAARSAARRLGVRAIRVRALDPDGDLFQLVVTDTGEVHDTTASAPAPPSPGGSGGAPAPARRWWRRRHRLQGPDRHDPAKKRAHPILLLIVGFPVAMIGFFIWILFVRGEGTTESVALPDPRQLPVVAPQGYSPVATWAVKVGTASGARTNEGVSADSERVYAATGSSDHITAYSAASGAQEWSTDLGAPLTAGPSVVSVGGEPSVVAATSTKLVTLDPASGEARGEWDLDATTGSQVRITATGPVVMGQSNTAQIIVDDELATRIMPASAIPVAPGPQDSLIAVAPGRVYTSTSSTVAGPGRAIDTPGHGEVSVAGWTGHRLILAYATKSASSNKARLVGYTAPTSASGAWQRKWTTEAVAAATVDGAGDQLPMMTAPNGTWGIYGTTAVTLDRGEATALREWSTTTVGNQIAFGTTPTRVVSAGPKGLGGKSAAETAEQQVTAPQAVHEAAAYLITGGGESTAWLYALTPAGGGRE